MKKLFGSLILFATLSVFAACGSSTTTSTSTYSKPSLRASAASLNVSATNQVIIDTRSAADYAAGHITNAINLQPSALDIAGSTELNTAPTGAPAVLGAAGVSNTATIIVYGAGNPSSDFGGPERVFWALEYMGAQDVHVLDGGYPAWSAITTNTPQTTAPTPTATTFTATVDKTKIASKADVLAHYSDTTNYAIVDSRFAADYNTAHIPNAINIVETDFLNADGTTKSYADLKTMLDSKGVTAGKTVITHCYVGYMSGQGYFMFRLMGYNVANYDGSWTEWAADTTLPTTAAPTGIAYIGGNAHVTVGWKAVNGATSYNVYYGTAAGVTTANTTKSTGITTTSTTITGLTNNTPYYFAVTAVNATGESAVSSEVSVIPAQYNTGLLTSTSYLNTNASAAGITVIDLRSSTLYGAGHVPNAVNIAVSTFDEYNLSGIGTMLEEDVASVGYYLASKGISNTDTIIIYDTDVSANAGRLFWILEYIGCKDVRILDGGYTKFVADGYAVNTTATTKTTTTFTANTEAIKLATKANVLAHYADTTNYVIVDSRNYSDATTNNYVTAHIPNAVSILTTDFTDATTKAVLPIATLETFLATKGITPGKTIITHCYVGYRSGQEYFIFRYLGYNVSNYDGSWTEWAADSTDPTHTGATP